MRIEIAVTHRAPGTLAPLRRPQVPLLPGGLSLRWLPPGSEEVTGSGDRPALEALAEQWQDLPRMLYPGDSVSLRVRLLADRELAPDSYRVVATIAQRHEPEPLRHGPDSAELAVEVTE